MYKQQIIEVIQEQKWLRITFQRKKDKQHVTRIIAPYDIFPQKTEDYKANDRLLGYTKAHENYKPDPIRIWFSAVVAE
jgi:N-acetylneuraminic acid mutarotase